MLPQSSTIGLHHIPIRDRVASVVRHAHCRSIGFPFIGSCWDRYDYIRQHRTIILAFMCMDGCVNISRATKTPWGIIQPFRNLDGHFDLGWPHLGEVLAGSVMGATERAQGVLCLVTYHYFTSGRHRGCAGFGYDTEEARTHAFKVVRNIYQCFGGKHGFVYPLVVGFETDGEALLLHDMEDNTVPRQRKLDS